MNAAIELDKFSVLFETRAGSVHALREVTLSVPAGGLVVVAGESGSGKSVLAHALTGLLPANAAIAGTLRVEGQDLYSMDERERRRLRADRLALVPQSAATALNPVRRLDAQLAATARHRNLDREQATQLMATRLGTLGLDWEHLQRRYPHQLSGGMQQRVVTVMATLSDPPVVIADEPTNGLDRELVNATADLLLDIHRRGATLVVITHDLRLAQRLGGATALLYGATLVEYGHTDTVLTNPVHPYAQGLVGALPENGGTPIPGLPVRLDQLPAGCTFASRCGHVRELCYDIPPPPLSVHHGTVWCVAADVAAFAKATP